MVSHVVIGLLLKYKYLVLIPAGVIEGPLVTLASGFMISQGALNPFVAFAVLVAADMISDLSCYAIGRYGNAWRVTKWVLRRPSFETRKVRLEKAFRERAKRIVFAGKLTHALSLPIMLAAGYFRMSLSEFVFVNLASACMKTALFLYIGFAVGAAYARFASNLETVSLAILALVVVAGAYYFIVGKRTERKLEAEV